MPDTKSPETKKTYDPVEMAIAVLQDRIQRLPKADRDDLYELTKELFSDSEEERMSAFEAMHEILEQKPIRVVRLPESDALTPWLEFISRRIREEREKAGLTQAELAERAGLPQSHISRLENGKHSPSAETREKIARALGIPEHRFDPCAGS